MNAYYKYNVNVSVLEWDQTTSRVFYSSLLLLSSCFWVASKRRSRRVDTCRYFDAQVSLNSTQCI